MANAYSPSSSFFGLGKETTPGTAVVPAVYVPITAPAPVDLITYLEDKGIKGTYDLPVVENGMTYLWGVVQFDVEEIIIA